MTKEQVRISRANRAKARKYFGLSDNDDFDLHHVDTKMKQTNIERYIQWNPEDLIVLTHGEHTRLHNLTTKVYKSHSDETKKKISESFNKHEYHYNIGNSNGMYGKPSPNRKKVNVYYKGEFIESFESKKQAAKAYNLSNIYIGKEITGNHSKWKGYMFLYAVEK